MNFLLRFLERIGEAVTGTPARKPSYQTITEGAYGFLEVADDEKLTVKMLREAGCTKLADLVEERMKELRAAGAPPEVFTEDLLIRTIIKDIAGREEK